MNLEINGMNIYTNLLKELKLKYTFKYFHDEKNREYYIIET